MANIEQAMRRARAAGVMVAFVASYQGEADYLVDGIRHAIRYRAFDDVTYYADVKTREIIPSVGTLRNRERVDAWPTPEAIAAFPEYVPARYNPETWMIEYLAAAPVIARDHYGWYAVASVEPIHPATDACPDCYGNGIVAHEHTDDGVPCPTCHGRRS